MKRTILQKVQYLIQERDHERAMREVLQIIKPSAYANNRELMTEVINPRFSSLLASTSSDWQQANVSAPHSQRKWSCRRHYRG